MTNTSAPEAASAGAVKPKPPAAQPKERPQTSEEVKGGDAPEQRSTTEIVRIGGVVLEKTTFPDGEVEVETLQEPEIPAEDVKQAQGGKGAIHNWQRTPS